MIITKNDVAWNFAATTLRMAASILVLPLVLKLLPPEDIGLWTIFLSIATITLLFDLGFGATFTRNVTYVFSGAKELKTQGFNLVEEDTSIDYGLLKGLLSSMRWFYFRIAIIVFIVLAIGGTFYLSTILKNYHGNYKLIYLDWIVFIVFICYQLYTLYYDSLLQGRGFIKRSKQIIIISQIAYLIIAIITLLLGLELMSMVLAQGISLLISRILSKRAFFDKTIKSQLHNSKTVSKKIILKSMAPNSIKIGITSLGGFIVSKSAVLIGSIYLPLSTIGSFGITKSLVDILASVSLVWYSTYYPQITKFRINNNFDLLKSVYIKSKLVLFCLFLIGAIFIYFLGEPLFALMKSNIPILSRPLLLLLLLIGFLEANHGMDGGILLTKNEVPFFKAAIISGAFTIILMFGMLHFQLTTIALILAPGIAQAAYQNWKWPLVVSKEFKLTISDWVHIIKEIFSDYLYTPKKNKTSL